VALLFALGDPVRVRRLALIEPPALWVLRARGTVDDATWENVGKMVDHSDSLNAWRGFPATSAAGQARTSLAPFLHQIVDERHTERPATQVLQLAGGHAPQIVAMDPFLAQGRVDRCAARHSGRRALATSGMDRHGQWRF
jgi:pimeloyl-ACP methyl ester carboxylesterase